jgi:hypothetical protein
MYDIGPADRSSRLLLICGRLVLDPAASLETSGTTPLAGSTYGNLFSSSSSSALRTSRRTRLMSNVERLPRRGLTGRNGSIAPFHQCVVTARSRPSISRGD